MTTLRHYALGEASPPSPHAVASSLPTMADVRAYEEKDARVLGALESGYPRFVVHPFVARLTSFYLEREALSGRFAVLVAGRRAAHDLVVQLGGLAMERVEDDVCLVHGDPADRSRCERLRKYLQHTGCGLSSRQAEDLLCAHGLKPGRFKESVFAGNAQAEVEAGLADLCGCGARDLLLCASGMSAFFAGFRAVQEYQRSRGRRRWIQLGWLYLDSGRILEEFLESDERLERCYDATDTEAILAGIEQAGEDLAAVVVECPTNPLGQACELEVIAEAVRRKGGVFLVDPTIASVYNLDLLPHADLVVTSLTKYAAHGGDVMIGALAVNPASPHYGELVLRTSRYHVPPYPRDLARLAGQMRTAPGAVAAMNANADRLAAFFSVHPAVRRVYRADKRALAALLKPGAGVGAVLSIELELPLEGVYDRIAALKGPSFGADFTLMAPFMWLAHYDLVTSAAGRDFLDRIGLPPDLIRISVGCEDYARIEACFAEALSAAVRAT